MTGVNTSKDKKMKLISVHIPVQLLEELEKLVKEGYFTNRSEAIRVAIAQLVSKYRKREDNEGEIMEIV